MNRRDLARVLIHRVEKCFLTPYRKNENTFILKQNEKYWHNSYYLHPKSGLSRCTTIDSPIDTLTKPNEASVSKMSFNIVKLILKKYNTGGQYFNFST